ncbi:MAG: hypothetical protein JWM60_859 [Solirubrobacterales bacterium]|nr:hypothetical protein [Solirubrobacterales bacterium]
MIVLYTLAALFVASVAVAITYATFGGVIELVLAVARRARRALRHGADVERGRDL